MFDLAAMSVNVVISSPIEYLTAARHCVQDWSRQNAAQIVTELCGFVTILAGTFLLHSTKDMGDMGSGLRKWRFSEPDLNN